MELKRPSPPEADLNRTVETFDPRGVTSAGDLREQLAALGRRQNELETKLQRDSDLFRALKNKIQNVVPEKTGTKEAVGYVCY